MGDGTPCRILESLKKDLTMTMLETTLHRMKTPKPIAIKLRRLRQERGWTQADLGQRIGRAQSRIAKWELSEGAPTPADIRALADAFDVSLEYLCDDRSNEPNKPKAAEPAQPMLTKDQEFLLLLADRMGVQALLDRVLNLSQPIPPQSTGHWAGSGAIGVPTPVEEVGKLVNSPPRGGADSKKSDPKSNS